MDSLTLSNIVVEICLYTKQFQSAISSAAVMDIFQVEARSWEQFEVHWRTYPVESYVDSYRYLLEWKYEGSERGGTL